MDLVSLLCISVFIAIFLVLVRLYAAGGVNHSHRDLTNKVIVVTGGTNGMGKLLVEQLADCGAQIISMSRNDTLAGKVIEEIKSVHKDCDLSHIHLDLNDMASVKKAAEELNTKVDHIDILVNNAGVMRVPYGKTAQGFEKQMGVNYLGHFLLTQLVLPKIEKVHGRVINLSSVASLLYKKTVFPFTAEEKEFMSMRYYCESKLAMAMFAKQLSKKNSNITAVSEHPGCVRTALWQFFPYWMQIVCGPVLRVIFKSPVEGVQTALYLVNEENVANGEYHADCKVAGKHNKCLDDDTLLEKLWDDSMEAVKPFMN
ncbi:restnol dehydrogenase, putative [Entamoeba invadens IP1]|uniref:Restnol dehydrogenase, putative n=1 Tax=Entamoeba invadens IP1 TaxID=370355 RepID=L7FKH2_ENTIV|nr:restnol dehydrogenase, putative [Entamoeba invadens IP1]ELP86368.1 restnol dehydrogenase, putative [Entamoeba invadens IP1]|eukprot:XP_004185714.1 restnol dehydrogenase, putative [Entamoeba invadens IP1]